MRYFVFVFGLAALSATADRSVNHGNTESREAVGDRAPTTNADYIRSYEQQLHAQFHGKRNGIALYSGVERNIENNGRLSKINEHFSSGAQYLEALQNYTSEIGCIPKLTSASHGWKASKTSGGDGVPIVDGYHGAGFYFNRAAQMRQVNPGESPDPHGRTFADFEAMLDDSHDGFLNLHHNKPTIRFCDHCLIQIYACNLSDQFAARYAAATGCQVVYGTGRMSPVDTKDGSLDTVWRGERDSDKGPDGKEINLNTRDGNFYKFTPVKDANGKVIRLLKQPVGTVIPGKNGPRYEYKSI